MLEGALGRKGDGDMGLIAPASRNWAGDTAQRPKRAFGSSPAVPPGSSLLPAEV